MVVVVMVMVDVVVALVLMGSDGVNARTPKRQKSEARAAKPRQTEAATKDGDKLRLSKTIDRRKRCVLHTIAVKNTTKRGTKQEGERKKKKERERESKWTNEPKSDKTG